MTRTLRGVAAVLLLCCASLAAAHDALPVALSLDQLDVRHYSLRARIPPALLGRNLSLGVAPPCASVRKLADLLLVRCPDGVRPPAITLDGPSGTAPLVLRVSYASGERRTIAAPPGTTRVVLPVRQAAWEVTASYFVAGLEHIAGGFDHLLFLVCLMLVARTPRRIVLTVTGFTLGHALTISLATFDLVRVPAGAVEVLIALSIAFAAAEIVRDRRTTLTWRAPALVATLFGLLHGLGFAGALREIGLPHGEVPVALAAFNLGIESGQLLFVAGFLLLALAVSRLPRWSMADWLRAQAAAWPIGLVASVWFYERLVGLRPG